MDSGQFDRLVRAVAQGRSRRTMLGAAVGALGAAGPLAWLTGPAVAKKKHKKKKKCKVQCGTKECGPSNCKGKSCGTCPSGQLCDGQGQCAGCASADQCTPHVCQQAACTSGSCVYTNLEDELACGAAGHICCGGDCVDPQDDLANCGDCGQACVPQGDQCQGGQCFCGGGPACPAGTICQEGSCVCPSGQVLCGTECLTGVCCAIGSRCTNNNDCCDHGEGADATQCSLFGSRLMCCKNGGSSCNHGFECCSSHCGFDTTGLCDF
jgi:hypothetical protein